MLTLFAVVAIAFVVVSEQEANSGNQFKLAETRGRPESDLLLAYALKQLVYDTTKAESSMQSHGLVTNLYGTNGSLPFSGTGRLHGADPSLLVDKYYLPHFAGRTFVENTYGSLNPPYTAADQNHVFLALTQADGTVLVRSFVRLGIWPLVPDANPATPDEATFDPYHPLCYNFWTDSPAFTAPPAALAPTGRAWLQLNTVALEPTRRALCQAISLRPRSYLNPFNPTDPNNVIFPPPEDFGGDAKNLPPGTQVALPGGGTWNGNESVWMDLGFPAQTGPDGRRYRPMFAFHVETLDSKFNLNVHGNNQGTAMVAGVPIPNWLHASLQGWGPWEVNPAYVLNATDTSLTPPRLEWPRLFIGQGTGQTLERGRYGLESANPLTWPFAMPGVNGSRAAGYVRGHHLYSRCDYDAIDRTVLPPPAAVPTGTLTAPGGYSAGGLGGQNPFFAGFPGGYASGRDTVPPIGIDEADRHPATSAPYPAPQGNTALDRARDRLFGPVNMEALLRHGDTGVDALNADIRRLLPFNFGTDQTAGGSIVANHSAARARRLVTTHSMDLYRPGVMPYLWSSVPIPPNPAVPSSPYTVVAGNPSEPPKGPSIPFPVAPYPTPPANGDFQGAWRSAAAALGKVNLNRYLRPYPHQGQGLDPLGTDYSATPLIATNDSSQHRFDVGGPAVAAQFAAAQRDRQQLARDIYDRLVAVTGASVPAFSSVGTIRQSPSNAQLVPLRWLAQIAVNIVDFIDEDDIATPFNFYGPSDALDRSNNPPTLNPNYNPNESQPASPTNPEQVPLFWVFGTELPKVVLNEVLVEASPPAPGTGGTFDVKVWAELLNTAPTATGARPPQYHREDYHPVPLLKRVVGAPASNYAPYRIVIADVNTAAAGPLADVGGGNDNDNVLGAPRQIRNQTSTVDFDNTVYPVRHVDSDGTTTSSRQDDPDSPGNPCPYPYLDFNPAQNNAPPAIPGPGTQKRSSRFFLIGPPGNTARSAIQPVSNAGPPPGLVPDNTPWLQSPDIPAGPNAQPGGNMRYSVTVPPMGGGWQVGGVPVSDDTAGVTVLLRRLANPYMPPQTDPAMPNYNPYITVDYLERVVPTDVSGMAPNASRGKRQPFAAGRADQSGAATYLVAPQVVAGPMPPATQHTFGLLNDPGVPALASDPASYPANRYDWLFHADRHLVSPMELLQVSAYQPHQLTHQFMIDRDANNTVENTSASPRERYQHRVPWFDEDGPTIGGNSASHRFYRLFEFLECRGDAVATGKPAFGGLTTATNIIVGPNPAVQINGYPFGVTNGLPWSVGVGSVLNVGGEYVTVSSFSYTSGANNFTIGANFIAAHPPGSPVSGNTNPQRVPLGGLTPLPPGGFTPGVYTMTVGPAAAGANTLAGQASNDGMTWGIIPGTTVLVRSPLGEEVVTVLDFGQPATPNSFRAFFTQPHTLPIQIITDYTGGRVSGKININTLTDPEVWQALTDPQSGNSFNGATTTPYTPPPPFSVPPPPPGGRPYIEDIYYRMTVPETRPFASQAAGFTAGPSPQWGAAGLGLNTTVFRRDPSPPAGDPNRLLFQTGDINQHPYFRYELLTKIYNNLTNRSNVFAVWITVGYFEVDTTTSGGVTATRLREIGRQDGRQVRHRFFAVIDRTTLDPWVQSQGPSFGVGTTPVSGSGRPLIGNEVFDPRRDYTAVGGPPQTVLYWSVIH
jgi:hypothetical protein